MAFDIFKDAGLISSNKQVPSNSSQANGAGFDIFKDAGLVPGATQISPSLMSQIGSAIAGVPHAALNLAQDIPAGIATGVGNVLNAPYYINKAINSYAPSVPQVMGKLAPDNAGAPLAPQDANAVDRLTQGAISYLPYAAGGEAALTAKTAPGILARLAPQAAAGAMYGATQSPTPISSALTGAALNTALGGAAEFIPSAKNIFGNFVLNRLNKSANLGNALSPAETAENLAMNYTGANGQPLPVDIGTATNNPTLKNIYNVLQYIPGSGVSGQKNTIQNEIFNKKINNISSSLEELGNNQSYQQQIDQQIGNAKNYLNNLNSGLENPENAKYEIKDATKSVFNKTIKPQSQANWSSLNNSKIDLNELGIADPFPNYRSAANNLILQKENLMNTFNSSSDLGAKLNAEINKAQSFLQGGKDFGATVPEMVERAKNIGKLSASLSGTNNYAASLLDNLKNGLKTDVQNALEQSGNTDLANQWDIANKYHQNYVLPFYENKSLRNSLSNRENIIPNPVATSQALHSQYPQILGLMPNDTKNSLLYQLISKGNDTSKGATSLTPKEIANTYRTGINGDIKSVVSQYNPEADNYFENLSSAFDTQKQLQQQEKISSALQKQLTDLKNKKYGSSLAQSSLSKNLAGLIEAGGIGGALAIHPGLAAMFPFLNLGSRIGAKQLTNPDLLQAYINQQKLPYVQSALINNLRRGAIPLTTPSVINQGGQ